MAMSYRTQRGTVVNRPKPDAIANLKRSVGQADNEPLVTPHIVAIACTPLRNLRTHRLLSADQAKTDTYCELLAPAVSEVDAYHVQAYEVAFRSKVPTDCNGNTNPLNGVFTSLNGMQVRIPKWITTDKRAVNRNGLETLPPEYTDLIYCSLIDNLVFMGFVLLGSLYQNNGIAGEVTVVIDGLAYVVNNGNDEWNYGDKIIYSLREPSSKSRNHQGKRLVRLETLKPHHYFLDVRAATLLAHHMMMMHALYCEPPVLAKYMIQCMRELEVNTSQTQKDAIAMSEDFGAMTAVDGIRALGDYTVNSMMVGISFLASLGILTIDADAIKNVSGILKATNVRHKGDGSFASMFAHMDALIDSKLKIDSGAMELLLNLTAVKPLTPDALVRETLQERDYSMHSILGNLMVVPGALMDDTKVYETVKSAPPPTGLAPPDAPTLYLASAYRSERWTDSRGTLPETLTNLQRTSLEPVVTNMIHLHNRTDRRIIAVSTDRTAPGTAGNVTIVRHAA